MSCLAAPANNWVRKCLISELEIRRRLYVLEKVASDAAVLASKATVDSAHWTKVSAIGALVTVIITGIAVLLQVATMKF